MPRTLPRVSLLALRKELLIAESELNRAQLMEKLDSVAQWQNTLSAGARVAGSVASAAALLMSGVRAFRSKRGSQNGAEVSWLQPLIKGAGLIATLCGAFRSRGNQERKK